MLSHCFTKSSSISQLVWSPDPVRQKARIRYRCSSSRSPGSCPNALVPHDHGPPSLSDLRQPDGVLRSVRDIRTLRMTWVHDVGANSVQREADAEHVLVNEVTFRQPGHGERATLCRSPQAQLESNGVVDVALVQLPRTGDECWGFPGMVQLRDDLGPDTSDRRYAE